MSGEKNLPPTEARIQKAREEGQVASSQDLMRSAACLSVFEGCRLIFTSYYQFGSLYFRSFIDQVGLTRDGVGFDANNVFIWIIASALVSLVLAAVAVVVWISVLWMQTTGPVIKKHPIEFKLDKFDPTKYFKNIFSAKTGVDVIGNIVKASVVAIIFYLAVRHAIRDAPMAVRGGIDGVGALIGRELISAIRQALIALFCLAVIDFGLQRALTLKDLKMSFQEMKEEHKEHQGNPEVKQHIRSLGHEILSEEGAPDPLAGANALIVNPTHLAVGLRYVRGEQRLPQVRVKAEDANAMDLIEAARDRKVPVVRHIWLARTLYELNEGAAIPREAFKAVAAVYRMLIQLDDAFGLDGEGRKPTDPSQGYGDPSPPAPVGESAASSAASTPSTDDKPPAAP